MSSIDVIDFDEMLSPLRFDHATGVLSLLDQRLLPERESWIECRTVDDVARAIKDMVVRGAPAIGCAAAYGMAIAARTGVPLAGRGGDPARDPAHGGEPVLGHRRHAPARAEERAATGPHDVGARFPRPLPAHDGRAHVPQDRRARRAALARRAACSPTATPARWPPAATAPRSASSAPRTSRSAASASSPTRRARSCRARG